MPIKQAGILVTQSGITSASVSDDRTILLTPRKKSAFQLKLTSGSPATGARVQVTTDDPTVIAAGTASWVVPSGTGYLTADGILVTTGEAGILTAVRADVSDGTWTLQVRSAAS